MTIEWPMIAVGGFLGSAHCLGMCGPFAILISTGARTPTERLSRQAVFAAGRISMYVTLGALAGVLGGAFSRQFSPAAGWLQLLAGIVLTHQGIVATGLGRGVGGGLSKIACLASRPLATLLRAGNLPMTFVAGLAGAFLPCGLLYGFLSLAASSASLATGALIMLVFSLGITPTLLAVGLSVGRFSGRRQQSLLRVAGWCVLAVGIFSIAQAGNRILAGAAAGASDRPKCPLCIES